jgi:transposase InsO family protein
MDAFSRKIVGYALGRTLALKLPLEALKMAIKGRNTDDLTHHSDKGIQYCAPVSMWTYLKPTVLKSV